VQDCHDLSLCGLYHGSLASPSRTAESCNEAVNFSVLIEHIVDDLFIKLVRVYGSKRLWFPRVNNAEPVVAGKGSIHR